MLKRSAKKKIPSVFECRTKLRASWQRRGLQGYTFLVLLRLRLSRALRRLWSRHYDVLHNRKRASQSERCYVEQEKLPSPAPICSSKMDCVPCRSKHLLDRVAREKSQVCSVEDAAWLILKAVEENLRKNARMAKIWNARYKHALGERSGRILRSSAHGSRRCSRTSAQRMQSKYPAGKSSSIVSTSPQKTRSSRSAACCAIAGTYSIPTVSSTPCSAFAYCAVSPAPHQISSSRRVPGGTWQTTSVRTRW